MMRSTLPWLLPLCALLSAIGASAAPAVVFDARNLDWEERCTVEALQGLVNRSGPRLYLDHGDSFDQRWLNVYAQRAGLRYEKMAGLRALLERFAKDAKGLVVYDPLMNASRYVAITQAGVDDLIPVCPAVLAGRSPSMEPTGELGGGDFTATDATQLEAWRQAANPKLTPMPGQGLLMQEGNPDPKSPWSFMSTGPVSVDLNRYPYFEADVASVEGEGAGWAIKLTWDRNGDGQIMGNDDDLCLPLQRQAGVQRWNIAELGGIDGRHTFALVQLHVAGKGAKIVWRGVRFVGADGRSAPPAPAKPLTDLGLPIRSDLRGRFSGTIAAYDWALKEMMPRCSRRLAHTVNGGIVDGVNVGVCGPMSGFDWQTQNKGFVFALACTAEKLVSYGTTCGGSPEQAAMYARILDALTPPAMINGYGDPEDVWCRLLSQHGHYSFHAYSNWSFHNKVPASGKPIRQKTAFTPQNTKPDTSKHYVCFMTSEGDTMKGPIPFFYGSWSDPSRGKVPVNWGINPLTAKLFPAMLEYFYDTATPDDYFFAGCSGAGYCYPDNMKDLEGFCRHTRDLCKLADLPCIDVWGASSWETLRRYEAITKPLSLTVNTGPARLGFIGQGTPAVFHELAYWQTFGLGGNNWVEAFRDDTKRAEAVKRLVGRIEAIAKRTSPPFVILVYGDLHSYDRHASLYREVAEALDPGRFKVARMDEAMSAVRAWSKDRVMIGSQSVNEPLHWAALTGVPTTVPIRLTSGFGRDVEATVQATIDGKPSNATVTLQPWETKELQSLSVSPTSEGIQQARLRIQAAGRSQAYAADVTGVPGAGAKAQSARLEALWGAGQLSHETGQAAPDAQATGGAAWASPPGGKPACIVYGPYATVPKGHYAVAFRLKLSETAANVEASTPVARIDVYAGGYQGSAKTHAERELKREDFATPGQWEWFTLTANWTGAPDCMETRVYWHAKADLMVDRVAVFDVR